MSAIVKRVLVDRIGGKKPGAGRAMFVAAAAGAAAAGLTYRVLRG
jgi:hypothetical protein